MYNPSVALYPQVFDVPGAQGYVYLAYITCSSKGMYRLTMHTSTSLQSCLNLHRIQHHIVAPINLAPHTCTGLGAFPNALSPPVILKFCTAACNLPNCPS